MKIKAIIGLFLVVVAVALIGCGTTHNTTDKSASTGKPMQEMELVERSSMRAFHSALREELAAERAERFNQPASANRLRRAAEYDRETSDKLKNEAWRIQHKIEAEER